MKINTRAWSLKERLNYYSEPITESGCFIWISVTNKKNYGLLRYRGRFVLAHRLSYQEFIGPIPDGLNVLHKCDIPACINPQHLFVGTHKDNQQDCIKKNRNYNQLKTHCKNGHEFNNENIYRLPNHPSIRYCRKCHMEREKIRRYVNHNG